MTAETIFKEKTIKLQDKANKYRKTLQQLQKKSNINVEDLKILESITNKIFYNVANIKNKYNYLDYEEKIIILERVEKRIMENILMFKEIILNYIEIQQFIED